MSVTKRQVPSPAPVKIAAGGVKKARNEGLKLITANDLFDGDVVYRTKNGGWTGVIARAALYEGADALTALELAGQDEGRVVGPYLMDADEGRNPSGRGTLRETIRRDGPSTNVGPEV
jgi:hypothetical protein